MNEEVDAVPRTKKRTGTRIVVGLLVIALIIMVISFSLQWYIIRELFSFTTDIVERQLVQQAPDGVEVTEIRKTFARVRKALLHMPLSYLQGDINLKKVKSAAYYALKANEDKEWTSEEVNTMLKMMNAAVGFKREVR
ncbi:MAG: hypothetical protein OXN17_21645 [Candidatus Poribacteria bacterium]|nr:hypothetical protein [Candidatus Poribacteria bacterium]MDE0506342.1 hypothetical protein [Candidatus Poribacteria bacterium]